MRTIRASYRQAYGGFGQRCVRQHAHPRLLVALIRPSAEDAVQRQPLLPHRHQHRPARVRSRRPQPPRGNPERTTALGLAVRRQWPPASVHVTCIRSLEHLSVHLVCTMCSWGVLLQPKPVGTAPAAPEREPWTVTYLSPLAAVDAVTHAYWLLRLTLGANCPPATSRGVGLVRCESLG